MKEEGGGIQTAVTSERALGSSRALLAQTAAVIARPEREHLPGAVRRWPRHRSTSWSPAASILTKTSLSTDLKKALQRSLRELVRWQDGCPGSSSSSSSYSSFSSNMGSHVPI